MSLHRFFATGPLASAGILPLSSADLHHLRDVLRLAAGDEIVLVWGGRATRVRLTAVTDTAEGEALAELPDAAMPRVALVQGLAKGEKMDDIVRKTTELGVSRIVPLAAERSVVRLDAGKAAARVERWRRIAAEAAKQSQRADIPEVCDVTTPESLADVLGDAVVLVCWEDAVGVPGIAGALAATGIGAERVVAVVVGPEGGLTAAEVALLEERGARTVTLGPTVLRTETAGVVATALAVHARGGLGAHDA